MKRIIIYCLLLFVFSSLPFVRYIGNIIVDTNSAFSFNLDQLSLNNITWSPLNGGNIGSFDLPLVPLNIFYLTVSKFFHIDLGLARIIFSIMIFAICSIGMFFFTRLLFKGKDKDVYGFIAGIYSIYNIYVLSFLDGSLYFLVAYLLMPLQGYFFLRSVLEKRYSFLILSSFLFLLTFNQNYIYNIVAFGVFFIFGFYFVIQNRISLLRLIVHLFILGVMLLIQNLYVLIPLVRTALQHREGVVSALSTEGFYNFDTTALNVLRTFGDWGFFGGYANEWYHWFSPVFRLNPIVVMSTFVIPLVFLITLTVVKMKKEYKWLAVMAVLTMLFIIGKNQDSPVDYFFEFATNHIPFFVAFKNTYKFTIISIFIYAVFIGFFLQWARSHFKSKKVYSLLTGVILVAITISSFPLVIGRPYQSARYFTKLPDYWKGIAEYIQKTTPETTSILVTPVQYTNVVFWEGKRIGLPTALTQTLINRQMFQPIYEMYSTQPVANSIFKIIFPTITKQKNIARIAGFLGISHILQMNDADWRYYKSASPSTMKKFYGNIPGISLDKSIGEVDLYKVDPSFVRPFVYSPEILHLVKDISVDNNIKLLNKLTLQDNSNQWSILLYKDPLKVQATRQACPELDERSDECTFDRIKIISVKKNNDTSYTVTLLPPKRAGILVLGTTFDDNWIISKNGRHVLASHLPVDVYKNGWVLSSKDLGNSQVTLQIRFVTQDYLRAGILISLGFIGIQIILLGLFYIYESKREYEETNK